MASRANVHHYWRDSDIDSQSCNPKRSGDPKLAWGHNIAFITALAGGLLVVIALVSRFSPQVFISTKHFNIILITGSVATGIGLASIVYVRAQYTALLRQRYFHLMVSMRDQYGVWRIQNPTDVGPAYARIQHTESGRFIIEEANEVESTEEKVISNTQEAHANTQLGKTLVNDDFYPKTKIWPKCVDVKHGAYYATVILALRFILMVSLILGAKGLIMNDTFNQLTCIVLTSVSFCALVAWCYLADYKPIGWTPS